MGYYSDTYTIVALYGTDKLQLFSSGHPGDGRVFLNTIYLDC